MPSDTAVADQNRLADAGVSPGRTPACVKLCGARVTVDAQSAIVGDVEIRDGRIHNIALSGGPSPGRSAIDLQIPEVDLSGFLLLPGLINAHDHLEFSLFPRLGRGPYPSARQWAKDIYLPESTPIREHLNVPKAVRLWWGAVKNLLCGVTTVCHHNEFCPEVFDNGFPVRVLKGYGWSHSLAFGKDIDAAFHANNPEFPFIIHLAEGTDSESTEEVFEMDRNGLLDSRTVIVHGVALDDAGHDLVARRGAALIWCPGSNLFTLGATLSPQRIEQNARIALGSDSSLTAGDLFEQIAIAREMGVASEHIFDLVTARAADVLKLRNGEGRLYPGALADIIAIPDCGLTPAEALVRTRAHEIEMVLLAGMACLLSRRMLPRFPKELRSALESISLEGSQRSVRAPVKYMLQETRTHLGGDVRLAGQQVDG